MKEIDNIINKKIEEAKRPLLDEIAELQKCVNSLQSGKNKLFTVVCNICGSSNVKLQTVHYDILYYVCSNCGTRHRVEE